MFIPYVILTNLLGYLYGSVNYAIIITRLTTGKDIRLQGNKNPGAANVSRSIGRGWGVLVLFLDMSKSLLPLILARTLVFPGTSLTHFTALLLTGAAALAGHCFPIFYRFRGGRGIATSLGVYLFFVPGEFILAAFAGWAIVEVIKKRFQVQISQWVPIMFVFLTPLLTTILNRVPPLQVFGTQLIGGHPFYFRLGIWFFSIFILLINLAFMRERFKEIGGSTS